MKGEIINWQKAESMQVRKRDSRIEKLRTEAKHYLEIVITKEGKGVQTYRYEFEKRNMFSRKYTKY